MKTLALAASVSLIAVNTAAAQDWRAAAVQDVDALHREIQENHPALVTGGDEAGFAQRLAAGYAAARERAGSVRDAEDYLYALMGFARSLDDASVSFTPNWQQPPQWDAQRWSQLTLGRRNGAYVVTWVDPAGERLPPLGSTLISCGDQSAEDLARARLDGWEGDLDQPGDREQTAPYLLWDRGNPFTSGLPASCHFSANGRGRGREYRLTTSFAAEPARRAAWAATVYTPQTPLGVESFSGGHWIHLHNLTQNDASQGLLRQVDQQLAAIQGGNVVLDLRGAREGTAALGYSLANRLWGVDYRVSQERIAGQIVYRVSPDNRQFFVDTLGRMQADPVFAANYPGAVQQMQELIAQFDAAAAAGQRSFSQAITPPIPAIEAAEVVEAEASTPAAAPVNAMRGNIVVLVDGGCRNACLDVVDMLSGLPNVRVAGTPTGTDSIHFEQTRFALPSGHGYLNYGHKTWIGRARASNTGISPAQGLTYTGNPTDEAEVRAWVQSLFGG